MPVRHLTPHHHQSINHKTADVTDKQGNQQSIYTVYCSYKFGKADTVTVWQEKLMIPSFKGGYKTLGFWNIKRSN